MQSAARAEYALRAAIARADSALAAEAFVAALEDKAGFDPNQPRVPAGRDDGGQWTRLALDRFIDGAGEVWTDIEREAGRRSFETLRFVRRNRASIKRVLGGVQALGGFGEIVGGSRVVAAGVATGEAGVGVPVAALGAYLVLNGYDNFSIGLTTLITGETQPTRLKRLLRDLGLTEAQAAAAEIGFAGGAGAAAGLTGRALEKAARQGLERAALQRFATDALQVRVNGQSLWLEQSIAKRGEAWEAFDTARTGFVRTPPGYKTFDQISADGTIAVSNKAIDLLGITYERSKGLFQRLSAHIDAVARFRFDRRYPQMARGELLQERRLHLLLSNRTILPAQTLQIEAAKIEAVRRGVVMTVEFAD